MMNLVICVPAPHDPLSSGTHQRPSESFPGMTPTPTPPLPRQVFVVELGLNLTARWFRAFFSR